MLQLYGANPSDVDKKGKSVEVRRGLAKDEMELYLANPIRYHSDHSALIALAIGLVSLDLPVLIVTAISEYLVTINEEMFFGQYSERKSWAVAALIKRKAKRN